MINNFEKLTGFSSKPIAVYVSEKGDDKNRGKCPECAVNTLERAYDIALCAKRDANIFISGNVNEGNVDCEKYRDLHISLVAYSDDIAAIDHLKVVCDTASSCVNIGAISLESGSFSLVNGSIRELSANSRSAFIYTFCGSIAKLNITGNCKDFSLFQYGGDIHSTVIEPGAGLENVQVIKHFERKSNPVFDNMTVSGKRITVNLPRMKAPDGTEFGVFPTKKIGVFDTYSGSSYQFGWGKTTYTCYAQCGDVAYYSDSRTDFTLNIEKTGSYDLEVCGEHNWRIRPDAMIRGFSAEEYLALPLDAQCWEDNGAGTISAKKYEDYSFDGTVYTAKKNHTAELSKVKLPEYTDRYFVGWAKDNLGCDFFENTSPTFCEGEKAYAVFTDKSELAVYGTSVDFNTEMTLKFFVSADAELLKNFDDACLGTLVIPTELLNRIDEPGARSLYFPSQKLDGDSLTFDLEKDYIDVPAQDTDVVNGKLMYSVELSELSLLESYIDYTVRPYVKFTDKNGENRIIYGPEYINSAYYTACQILKEKEAFSLSDAEIKSLNDGVAKIAEHATAPATGRTLPYRGRGEVPYDDLALDIPYEEITEHQFRQGKNFYKTNSGTIVREIHIEHTNPDVKPSVFGVTADCHINRVDRTGKDKYDAEVMFSFWTRPGFSQKWVTDAFLNSTKLLNTYDLFVLGGDTVDYVTYGTLDYIKEKVLDKYDNCIFAMGNHEPVKNMQTTIPDIDEVRNHRQLYEYFDKDYLNCYTHLLNDSVLLITFDNGSYYKYNKEQYEKLKAAIKLAREKGYIILMFQHIMISTGNPDDTHVKALLQGFGDSCTHPDGRNYYNFATVPVTDSIYDFQINMHTPNDTLNEEMYDLITQNTDVIRGLFVGHNHRCDYLEILPRNSRREVITDGSKPVLPVHNMDANPYSGECGNILKVVVNGKK